MNVMNSKRPRRRPAQWLLYAAAGLAMSASLASVASVASAAAADPAPAAERAYLAQNDAAMDRMMADMAVQPSGDVDHDFVAMMVPHHQGAIEMAQAVLRYGHNEQLRRIAQEIIVDQQQEIIAMRLALGQPLPPAAPAATGVGPAAGAASADATPDPDLHAHPHHDMHM